MNKIRCDKCLRLYGDCVCGKEGTKMDKEMTLDLDALYQEGYFYTKFDIGGAGHSITIKKQDKEKFLDAFAKEWRDKAESMLVMAE